MPPFFMFFILLLYIFINIIAIVYIVKFLFVIANESPLLLRKALSPIWIASPLARNDAIFFNCHYERC